MQVSFCTWRGAGVASGVDPGAEGAVEQQRIEWLKLLSSAGREGICHCLSRRRGSRGRSAWSASVSRLVSHCTFSSHIRLINRLTLIVRVLHPASPPYVHRETQRPQDHPVERTRNAWNLNQSWEPGPNAPNCNTDLCKKSRTHQP